MVVWQPHLMRVSAAGQHRLLVEPHDTRRDLVGDRGRRVNRRRDVAAADVDLLGEGERHRVAALRNFEIAVGGDDARDMDAPAGRLDHHLVARLDLAARHRAGIAAEIEMRPVHPLHGEAERLLRAPRATRPPSRDARAASARDTNAYGRWGTITLSPLSAETGMQVIYSKPSGAAKVLKSSAIASKRA